MALFHCLKLIERCFKWYKKLVCLSHAVPSSVQTDLLDRILTPLADIANTQRNVFQIVLAGDLNAYTRIVEDWIPEDSVAYLKMEEECQPHLIHHSERIKM